MGGAIWEEWERIEGNCPTYSGPGSLLSSQANPLSSKAPPGHVGPWGQRKEAKGRTAEAGRRSPSRLEEQERRGGRLPHPFMPRKPAGLPGEVLCPLRPGVGATSGPLLFLEPKPHPPQHPRPFPALWVLSIGFPHYPNLALT